MVGANKHTLLRIRRPVNSTYKWVRSVEVESQNLAKLIARRLRQIRKARGLRQQDLEHFGVNCKYYQRIEAGKVNLTLRSLDKVASALGVKVLELFQSLKGKEEERADVLN
jgi:DNA-binding XRE family transcriptional regulator